MGKGRVWALLLLWLLALATLFFVWGWKLKGGWGGTSRIAAAYRLSPQWPEEILALEPFIVGAARAYGHEPDLLAALIRKESWFSVERCPKGRPDLWGNPGSSRHKQCAVVWEVCPDGPCSASCTSRSGAIGPMQVMPEHFRSGENGRNLAVNINRGAQILRNYIDRKGGDLRTGLAAYYCGPNLEEYPQRCWAYADKVLEFYGKVR